MRVERIGAATLYCGDCREVLPTLSGVDAVVTDPPYGVGFKYASHDDTDYGEEGYGAWLWGILEQCERLCSPGSPVFVWQAQKHFKNFHEWFPREWRVFAAAKNFVQMHQTAMQYAYDPVVVWWVDGEKPWSAGTANRDFHIANTAPVIGTGRNNADYHPCQRPIDQVEQVIEQWVRHGSLTLDPFMGSGTTGVACARLGRSFIGIECEPKYFDIACRRIEKVQRQADLFVPQPDLDAAYQHQAGLFEAAK